MKLLNGFWSCLAMACFCATPMVAQDLSEQTLDFGNITSTNVNQTVAETDTGGGGAGAEKEIEFGDWDNDGDMDAAMAVARSDFGERRNKLYRNDNGVLNEVTGAPVVSGFLSEDVARSLYLRDYNDDGLLDIIVICDSNSGTGGLESPGRTKLYIQTSPNVFTNQSNDLPLNTVGGAACNGVSEDFDGNGLYDLMTCNYPNISQDHLAYNGLGTNSAGEFSVVTNTNYPTENLYGVHSEAADMNGDNQLDLLVANWTGSSSFIYYNNNMDLGSGQGDFSYGSTAQSRTSFGAIGGGDERAMIPCDFNNDGLMDMYFANFGSPSRNDWIFRNTGNDGNNKATFAQQLFPGHNSETHKITCNDLDGDGLMDMIVMSELNRPFIYRNVSSGNEIRFVEWDASSRS